MAQPDESKRSAGPIGKLSPPPNLLHEESKETLWEADSLTREIGCWQPNR